MHSAEVGTLYLTSRSTFEDQEVTTRKAEGEQVTQALTEERIVLTTMPRRIEGRTLLATTVVDALRPNDRVSKARALLDQSSKLSFVTESLVEHLKFCR